MAGATLNAGRLRKMSNSKWKKRWLYDSDVEIPKTTKWRRNSEFIEPVVDDDFRLRDVQQDLSSETIKVVIDLGNNTSLLKKQKILGDCLSSTKKKTLSSVCLSEKKEHSVELDLQTANVKAYEYDAVASDYASNKPLNNALNDEMLEMLHFEGEEFFILLFSSIIGPYLSKNF